ncbi:MAG: 7-carboxy-7-deazaguanine synthase QueE [Verrucomicrobiales bacterium]
MSIQGEGMLAGVPSVFIRTSGCNLRCTWCDTRYASWEPEGGEMDVAQIMAELKKLGPRHVVVTGGEPMIARGIGDLLAALERDGRHITVETAATALPGGAPCHLASLSPKLSNSAPKAEETDTAWIERHERRRRQPEVIREWIRAYPFQLKFVVTSESDLDEIGALLADVREEILPERVLLMPEGTDSTTLQQRALWLVDVCKSTGFRFCPRLHIELFGLTRGT